MLLSRLLAQSFGLLYPLREFFKPGCSSNAQVELATRNKRWKVMVEWGSEKPYFKPGRATLADVLPAPRLSGYLLLDIGLRVSAWIFRLFARGEEKVALW